MTAQPAGAPASVLGAADRAALAELCGAAVRFDEPLAEYTSWKIGGPADAFVSVPTSAMLGEILRFTRARKVPWFLLGSGSNILIGDGGIRGIVLRLAADFTAIEFDEGEPAQIVVHAGASASMALLTAQAAGRGAIGIGSLAGIPGSVGGSLRMNAGTDRETGEFVRSVWVQTPAKPDIHPVTVQYYYRHTSLTRDAVVARVTFAFERGDPKTVRAEMQARLVRRKATQPLQWPNAGSCFRNPPGDFAARLIEAAGAKGWREGGAEVSTRHANFIVNVERARARDVAVLLARVRRAVADRFGVDLQPEVHLVGVFVE